MKTKLSRRERLMATLKGEPIDRPAVNLYEIGGFKVDCNDDDEFNVYKYPTWKPLLDLAYEQTDIIRMVSPIRSRGHEVTGPALNSKISEIYNQEEFIKDGSRFTSTTLNIAGKTLTSLTRRDPEVDTTWVVEHLIKNTEDIKAYLQIPEEFFYCDVDIDKLKAEDQAVGDAGIVMVETEDPLCMVASLFSMEDFTVVAMTEQKLFHKLLDKVAPILYERTEKVAKLFPGHLWRIFGPEYATEPYLPPNLFKDYVVNYTSNMVDSIQRYGGFARIHAHGRIKNIMDYIVGMGAAAIDPVEPPPNGDVKLKDFLEAYGENMVIFGNIEISDLEGMVQSEFETLIRQTLDTAMSYKGRGFVLMPTSSPYGREISSRTMQNYETLVRLATEYNYTYEDKKQETVARENTH